MNGSNNRIEGNNASGNDTGVEVVAAENLLIRNSASDNSTDYSIASGNSYGPTVNVEGVGDISGTPNGNHPLANFGY